MKTKIKKVDYRSVYDSRGVETLEVDIYTEAGWGRAAAPFGAPGSRGEFEAAADTLRLPLFKLLNKEGPYTIPYPLGNIIGGGAHSLGPAPDMQEHLVVPIGAKSMQEAVAVNLAVHEEAGRLLEKKDPAFAGGTDDESAWTANLNDFEALEVLEAACAHISDKTGVEIRMGLDLAADRLWDGDKKLYHYTREGIIRNTQQQLDYLCKLTERFNLIYVEDGFNSNDYEAFAALNSRIGKRSFVCADDLYASNAERTLTGVTKKSAGIMILKTNQIGSVTGLQKTAAVAKEHEVRYILSHRSGETPDDSIAHLAVALNALMIKTGVKGGERLAKLNELMRIEGEYDLPMVRWPEF
ncbi:MAG TPA: hypothetical protein VN381_09335 [Anaerovoracaceae bacterium]|nr:hypothetical protein [Anaerovoracaceae bacterium]